MARVRATTSGAKQRVLETANRLFYQEGVRGVGIDRIIAEADVAKMTLYSHFPSKDDLIVAVLRYRDERLAEFFSEAMQRHGKRTKDGLRAFFAVFKEFLESPGFRGCAFQNAAVELADPAHPGTQFAREHKRRFAAMLRGLVEQSCGAGAAKLVPAIALLVEGAVVTSLIDGKADAADVARDAALNLVRAAK